jgi:hypothetical protein
MPIPVVSPRSLHAFAVATALAASAASAATPDPALRSRSGIHPHLALFNEENECGTGGVVPWADRLWVMTYAPHRPRGSTDRLYEIDSSLHRTIRPESIGGTPANRMIHRESGQLLLGPYLIDRNRTVRVIPSDRMPGRLTGTARHLSDPTHKVYYATMEEGFYEVDVHTLDVRTLYPDANGQASHAGKLLPGYHGKGLFSGQGRLIYANNGELSPEAQRRPDIESGCLAEWNGTDWHVVRRNQFTEVTGPGGILGNPRPESDPVWSVGWDHRSLILMLLDHGTWHAYRLPKSSHSYDGAHGWNTEWPRIRDIGERQFLMTMHGAFWSFPSNFSAARSSGIRPRSNYLKVVGDFCRWKDQLVFGCDDSARSEFLNTRAAKGKLAPPGRSHSNLWFADPDDLDDLGPVLGRGAVWSREDVAPGVPSDPFLFDGYDLRSLHLTHESTSEVRFSLEVDRKGNGRWTPLRDVAVPPRGHRFVPFRSDERAAWIRVVPSQAVTRASAVFAFRNRDRRSTRPSGAFRDLDRADDLASGASGGLLHAGGGESPVLRWRVVQGDRAPRLLELDATMTLKSRNAPGTNDWLAANAAVPSGVLTADAASVLYRDARGTWRLPRGDASFDAVLGTSRERVCREVCTERDLFNAHGTFFELPAENAGGFAKVRPVATHNRHIADYASYRGMLCLAGLRPRDNRITRDHEHWIRSDDGEATLWVGNVEDLWKLGKPRGVGGPWKETSVEAGQPSDPYLMTGYDRKSVQLSHDAAVPVRFDLEVDLTGEGLWVSQEQRIVAPGAGISFRLPDELSAYWLRVRVDTACHATAQCAYE